MARGSIVVAGLLAAGCAIGVKPSPPTGEPDACTPFVRSAEGWQIYSFLRAFRALDLEPLPTAIRSCPALEGLVGGSCSEVPAELRKRDWFWLVPAAVECEIDEPTGAAIASFCDRGAPSRMCAAAARLRTSLQARCRAGGVAISAMPKAGAIVEMLLPLFAETRRLELVDAAAEDWIAAISATTSELDAKQCVDGKLADARARVVEHRAQIRTAIDWGRKLELAVGARVP